MRKLTKRLMSIYEQGRVALDCEQFQIWGSEKPGVYAHSQDAAWGEVAGFDMPRSVQGVIMADRFIVPGEYGHDWSEMVEVASYLNDEADGAIYFVGNRYTAAILKPSYRELWEITHYHAMRKSPLTEEEKMVMSLLIGGDWVNQL